VISKSGKEAGGDRYPRKNYTKRSLSLQKLHARDRPLQNINHPESQKLVNEKAITTVVKTIRVIAHCQNPVTLKHKSFETL
jgi:hypothetical protein